MSMLSAAVNLTITAGLVSSAFVALRLSRKGRMRLNRLWVMPAVGVAAVVAMHRPLEATPLGLAALIMALFLGAVIGWLRGRGSLLLVDLESASFVIRRGRWLPVAVVGSGLLTLLLSNLYTTQMLRLVNAFLVLGLAIESSHRLYLLHAWKRAQQAAADAMPRLGQHRETASLR